MLFESNKINQIHRNEVMALINVNRFHQEIELKEQFQRQHEDKILFFTKSESQRQLSILILIHDILDDISSFEFSRMNDVDLIYGQCVLLEKLMEIDDWKKYGAKYYYSICWIHFMKCDYNQAFMYACKGLEDWGSYDNVFKLKLKSIYDAAASAIKKKSC